MSHLANTMKKTQIGCMHLGQNGIVGYHQATVPQLLIVVQGEGWVRGEEDKYRRVTQGNAVLWAKDEWHETKTEQGLTAIVIESEELNISSLLSLRDNLNE
ncbi:cupin [Bacillus sp. THAF10]|uniref:cupin n=1 Tax=Bacillus sp. THAF10 TaxID=2587848 RepID=UPI003464BF64